MVLDLISVQPGVTVYHQRYCHNRRVCRGKGPIVFMIRDGRARALTGEERAKVVHQAGRGVSPDAS
jgi:hypothetical protein